MRFFSCRFIRLRLIYPIFVLLFCLFLFDVYLNVMTSFKAQVQIIINENGTIYASRNVKLGTDKIQLLGRKPVTIPQYR